MGDPTVADQLKDFRNIANDWTTVLNNIQKSRPDGGREIALAITKLQEAKMWAGDALRVRGEVTPNEGADAANPHAA